MSTVGLSFGSATSGTGFDVATTVTAIMASESAIETPWNTQLAALKAQDTVFTSLGTDLATLTTATQALTDFSGVLSNKQGASSDTSLLELTGATSAATAGSHTVVVSSLASTSSNYSDTVAAADVLSGSITINGTVVTVGSSSNTLATLATAINAASVGVTASVITDSSGSRLSLVSSTSGAAGQITATSSLVDSTTSASLALHTGNTGTDAAFTVDGISLTSASNTVSNAIPGVSFQLLGSDLNTTVQVQITNDTSSVTTAITALVTAYNAVVKDIKTQEGNDSSGNAEPLYGNPVLASIQSALTSALFGGSASGTIKGISQLGITANTDGTLSLNTDTLSSVLSSSYADVTGYLQNTGSFGVTFSAALNNLGTQAPSGVVYLAQQQNSTEEASLNQNLTNENLLLAAQKTSLTTELNTANQILQSIPAQLDEVNVIYSASTGYNTKG